MGKRNGKQAQGQRLADEARSRGDAVVEAGQRIAARPGLPRTPLEHVGEPIDPATLEAWEAAKHREPGPPVTMEAANPSNVAATLEAAALEARSAPAAAALPATWSADVPDWEDDSLDDAEVYGGMRPVPVHSGPAEVKAPPSPVADALIGPNGAAADLVDVVALRYTGGGAYSRITGKVPRALLLACGCVESQPDVPAVAMAMTREFFGALIVRGG